METIEAKILLKNLLKRIRQVDEDNYELSGSLTDDELTALRLALSALDSGPAPASASALDPPKHPNDPNRPFRPIPAFASPEDSVVPELDESEQPEVDTPVLEIDSSVLDLPDPPQDRRLCLDFGTAMSKVTLVRDKTADRSYEEIEVLHLGTPGDQEDVSLTSAHP